MHVAPAAFQESQFRAEVEQVATRLKPDVIDISLSFGQDWSGDPAVYFMTILADSATTRDRLWDVNRLISDTICEEIQPTERWGLLPYFNYRSLSEQIQLDQPAVA